MTKIREFDRRALEIALEGIKRQREEAEQRLEEIRKTERQFLERLRQLSTASLSLPSGKPRKRLAKGFAKETILETMMTGEALTWDMIQARIEEQHGVKIPRTTIAANLVRLERGARVACIDNEYWKLILHPDEDEPEDHSEEDELLREERTDLPF